MSERNEIQVRLTVPQIVYLIVLIAGAAGAWYDLRSQVHDVTNKLDQDHQQLIQVISDVATLKAHAPRRGRNRGED